jgi:hypothetical protein
MREPQHKLSVEFSKDQEDVKLGHCFWGWSITYEFDLGWIHMYALLIHDVSQIFYSLHVERTLLQIGI